MPGLRDGPGVLREVLDTARLERDPALRGLLLPPTGGSLPEGVAPRGAGMRLASINIHMGVPAGRSLDPANEEVLALRAVARGIDAVDPDVVFLQEVRNRPWRPGQAGVADSVSALAHLARASDLAFTPAISGDPATGPLRHYGTAILARNGHRIERAANVALPNLDTGIEPRSAGVAAIARPDGRADTTVIGTHLTNLPTTEEQLLRDAQLGAIADVADAVRSGQPLVYRDALDGSRQLLWGFPGRRIVLAGDINQQQAATDAILVPRGFVHAADLLEAGGAPAGRVDAARAATAWAPDGTPHRIDHAYLRGVQPRDVTVSAIPRHELPAGDPTDHRALVIDLPD